MRAGGIGRFHRSLGAQRGRRAAQDRGGLRARRRIGVDSGGVDEEMLDAVLGQRDDRHGRLGGRAVAGSGGVQHLADQRFDLPAPGTLEHRL